MQFLALALAFALPLGALAQCNNPEVVSSTYVGEHKNVLLQQLYCPDLPRTAAQAAAQRVVKRDNVCGAPCATNCFPGTANAPNAGDCTVIADALLYDSQNVGALFTLDPSANTSAITMQYHSCSTLIVDQAGVPLTYCRSDWSSLVNWLASDCSPTTNSAHGGNCVANDGRWFVQVNAP
ncbi:hypothetical protein BC834DRAFT_818017 [Gloeopeniophorella convolvens]|nr:hypothetical protein BC834DRAFT_818017 [Gloeopeniophorella convolvens]